MNRELAIAALSILGMSVHLGLRLGNLSPDQVNLPLWIVLGLGGTPLVWGLLMKALRKEFGSDLLAGISILTSVALGEYLAGSFVVLMLSGGEALEQYAVRRASSVLEALAKRMPDRAHRKVPGSPKVEDIRVGDIRVDDQVVLFPHEICPVDGVVLEGRGRMDESYLTGEPYLRSKVPGSEVLSGAINGDSSITIRATKQAEDSRYAKIMQVMRDSEQSRPHMRRLGDRLGAVYTPVAVALALLAWAFSGQARRFLAVLVIATPCPLLIAIPVAIIGAISLAARRGIIIKDPSVLERVDDCKTMILDKTGTLTVGRPKVTAVELFQDITESDALGLAASLERYSRHPLASALVQEAENRGLTVPDATEISEEPGKGLRGTVDGLEIAITSRKRLSPDALPALHHGLEAILLRGGTLAARFLFHDEPRPDTRNFLGHLTPHHGFARLMIVSGDREEEVRYLGEQVGISAENLRSGQTPEQKVEIVKQETALAPTLFLGDGINDAPALTAATVGLAMGQNSDITSEAAGAVILESSLRKVDELLHIARRMRRIALQSAVGGMLLSVGGMLFAAAGMLTPLQGAIGQELIDVWAVLNALRMSLMPRELSDYEG